MSAARILLQVIQLASAILPSSAGPGLPHRGPLFSGPPVIASGGSAGLFESGDPPPAAGPAESGPVINPLSGLPVADPDLLNNPPALVSITNFPPPPARRPVYPSARTCLNFSSAMA